MAPLIGVIALGACAQQESNTISTCDTKSALCVGSAGNGSGGTGSTAGARGTPSSSAGMTAAGATAMAGAAAGGSAGAAAGAPSAGTAGAATGGTAGAATGGTGGAATGGTAGGGASGAGAGGSAGTGGAGGSAGSAGAAGSSGSAGAGGQGALCVTAVPARSAWTATSNVSQSTADLPPNAIDTDLGSRFATGTKMLGGEYLQIDMGSASTVDQVTVLTSNADYGRHLKIKMSNTPADTAAATLAEADGLMGLQTFSFTPTTARYLLIQQTGTLASGITWWSVYDVNAYCK